MPIPAIIPAPDNGIQNEEVSASTQYWTLPKINEELSKCVHECDLFLQTLQKIRAMKSSINKNRMVSQT
jgi:hypothetical protein